MHLAARAFLLALAALGLLHMGFAEALTRMGSAGRWGGGLASPPGPACKPGRLV